MNRLPKYLDNFDWLTELELLIVKHSSLGIGAEVFGMTCIELWGLYLMLKNRGD